MDKSAVLPDGTGIWAASDGSVWVYGDTGIIRLDAQGNYIWSKLICGC